MGPNGGAMGPSWHYVKVLTWTSNCFLTAPQSILLGDRVAGILVASYGGTMAAGLDTWRVMDADEWFPLAAHGPPNPMTDFDLNWWAIEGLADLGGNAFRYAGEADISGIRVKPPPLGPHQYHDVKKEEKKKKAEEAEEVCQIG